MTPRRTEHSWSAKRHYAHTTRHAGYAVSYRIRMQVEEIFGWLKTIGGAKRGTAA
jgi:hypothetical protein